MKQKQFLIIQTGLKKLESSDEQQPVEWTRGVSPQVPRLTVRKALALHG